MSRMRVALERDATRENGNWNQWVIYLILMHHGGNLVRISMLPDFAGRSPQMRYFDYRHTELPRALLSREFDCGRHTRVGDIAAEIHYNRLQNYRLCKGRGLRWWVYVPTKQQVLSSCVLELTLAFLSWYVIWTLSDEGFVPMHSADALMSHLKYQYRPGHEPELRRIVRGSFD